MHNKNDATQMYHYSKDRKTWIFRIILAGRINDLIIIYVFTIVMHILQAEWFFLECTKDPFQYHRANNFSIIW